MTVRQVEKLLAALPELDKDKEFIVQRCIFDHTVRSLPCVSKDRVTMAAMDTVTMAEQSKRKNTDL